LDNNKNNLGLDDGLIKDYLIHSKEILSEKLKREEIVSPQKKELEK